MFKRRFLYPEWDLNPHGHHWPLDFKSSVSTNSTIRAVCACVYPSKKNPFRDLA